MALLVLRSRHAPAFKSTVASVDPALSQVTSSGQETHVPVSFMYAPFSHTHTVLPSPNVVKVFDLHFSHSGPVPGDGAMRPCGHGRHFVNPFRLYVPAGQRPVQLE